MFKKITLDNGLRILTAPMQGTNTVTVLVMCGTGSDYEGENEHGISHFLEHMFFKGTTNRPKPDQIRQELDQMGSISNAFTGHETTGYFIKAGKLYGEAALELLADIYKHSLLAGEEVEREKQVVVEEMHLDRDTPTTYVWQLWEKLLYGDQPAGRSVSGEEETVRRLRRDECVTYFTHQYVAENTAVVVAGNIDEAKVVARVKKLFSDIRRAAPRTKPSVREGQKAPRVLVETRSTDQTHLVVGFRGYDAFHPRRWAAELAATVLGGSFSSRMFASIREKLGLAYAVFSESENYSNRGYLVTYAGVAHENAEKTIAAILSEYRRIREELVPAAELNRTKDFLKGRMLMALEVSHAVAGFVGGEEMLTARPLTPDEIFAIIDAVTSADLKLAAEELFRPERLNAVVLGPLSDSGKVQLPLDSFS